MFFLTLSRLTSRVLTDKTYLNCPSWVALRRLCRTHCVGNSSSVAHNSRSISYMQWVFCCAHLGWKPAGIDAMFWLHNTQPCFAFSRDIMCNATACRAQPVTIGESVRAVNTQLIDIWHWWNMAFIYFMHKPWLSHFAVIRGSLLTVQRSCRALPFIPIFCLFCINGWMGQERAMTMAECRSVRSERHYADRWAHSTGFPPMRFPTCFTVEVTPDEWKHGPPCADGQRLSFHGQVLFL